MAAWKVKPDPQVAAIVHREDEKVEHLCRTTTPEKFATHPQYIAHRALTRLIIAHLTEDPIGYSYSYKACGDKVRFADTFGWRLIITMHHEHEIDEHGIDHEQGIVRVRYLSRIKNCYTSPQKTFDKWENKIPPG